VVVEYPLDHQLIMRLSNISGDHFEGNFEGQNGLLATAALLFT